MPHWSLPFFEVIFIDPSSPAYIASYLLIFHYFSSPRLKPEEIGWMCKKKGVIAEIQIKHVNIFQSWYFFSFNDLNKLIEMSIADYKN